MNFYAVIGTRGNVGTPSIVVDRATQDLLTTTLDRHADSIVAAEHVAFEPGYRAESGEILAIAPYTLPPSFALIETAATAADVPPMTSSDLADGPVRGLIGVDWDGAVPKRFVIQRIDARHLLRPERLRLFLAGDRFVTDPRPGIEVADRVDAVLEDSALYVASWTNAHAVLDLSQYMREATIAEAQEFLRHKKFVVDDDFDITSVADSVVRRKVTSITENRVLDKCSVEQLRSYAASFHISVEVRKNRIVIPADKKAFKSVLSLLDEDLLSFEPTRERWIVNSKRRAGR